LDGVYFFSPSQRKEIIKQPLRTLRLCGEYKNQMLSISEHPEGIIFKIFVQPRSAKNMIVGLHEDTLKLKLTAPPVDNAANKMCIKFLAKSLGISKSQIEIISGHTSRSKQVLLRSDQSKITKNEYKRLKGVIQKLIPQST
jgi:uncharacterized protein (TIGR00251 family)